eukprot:Gb_22280 [translate_table: standard]
MEKSGPNSGTEQKAEKPTFCVTGAAGYIGSWLVKCLLEKGYNVHATVRDPGNTAKTWHLLSLPGAQKRLSLFKADLGEEGSFDLAVGGCEGVFHLATPMCFSAENPDEKVIQPSIKGTLNVLEACVRSKCVRRVVYTSSISTISAIDETGRFRESVDESCWVSLDSVKRQKPQGWMYVVSKALAEQAAFDFAKENNIDVVSIIPVTVAGSFFTSTTPTSVQVVLSLITGNLELYGILKAVESRIGSVSFVHIEDICNAHIYLMEQASAQGRYICSVHSCTVSGLAELFYECYPQLIRLSKVYVEQSNNSTPVQVSSRKLLDLGFRYKHGMTHIIEESIECCKQTDGFAKY